MIQSIFPRIRFFLGWVAIWVGSAICLPAATVAYWQMNGTTGNNVATLTDSVGSHHGTAASQASGPTPVYSNVSLGGSVYDPVSGTIVNSSGGSIRFQNTGGMDTTTGGIIRVTNNLDDFKLQNFTVEGWFQITDNKINYPTIMGFTYAGNLPSWEIDLFNNSTLRVRSDHTNPPGQGSGPGFNQGFSSTANIVSGQWYHFAITFTEGDPSTSTPGKFDLYLNYVRVGGGNLSGGEIYNLVYPTTGGEITIGNLSGGRAFDGYLTDLRISDEVLQPSQFLQVVPEPGKSVLLLLGSLSLVCQRRRKYAALGKVKRCTCQAD